VKNATSINNILLIDVEVGVSTNPYQKCALYITNILGAIMFENLYDSQLCFSFSLLHHYHSPKKYFLDLHIKYKLIQHFPYIILPLSPNILIPRIRVSQTFLSLTNFIEKDNNICDMK
jgi:hypothetical protein